jgi:DNA excision repair protein ERCC-4
MSFGDEHFPEDEPVRMPGADRGRLEGRRAPVARPCILIDTREQAPLRFSDAVDVETVTLETGDYSLRGFSDSVRVERKSKADLVACVGPERERFLDQMQRLARYQVRALVVEASWAELAAGAYRSNTNPKSVTGTLLALMTDLAVPVLLAGDSRAAAEAVERLLTRVARNGVSVAA